MIRLGTAETTNCAEGSELLRLQYGYGAGANNGNLGSQTIWTRKDATSYLKIQQSYTYDVVNRLSTASESVLEGGTGGGWTVGYSYDVAGNVWGDTRTTIPLPFGLPRAASQYDGNNRVKKTWDNVDLATGAYDAAGNLLTHRDLGQMTYDAENRLTRYQSGATVVDYRYDGEGRRVKRAAGAVTTQYVYDAQGQLAAEYVTGATPAGAGTQFLTADHLGSTRTLSDSADVVSYRDYFPFGEEIPGTSTYGRRDLVAKYSGGMSALTVKFTGKERDAETGLDYFGARYYSGAQGRFTSPDPPLLDQHIDDPQSWNLYAYGRNNPLRYIDPTGNAIELLGDEEQRKKELALLQKSLGNDKAASRVYINEVKEGDKTRYFVGIKGDVGSFMKMGETSHDLANLVQHKNVVEFGLTSQNLAQFGGAVTYEKGEVGNSNIRVLVNPDQMDITNRNLSPNSILGMSRWEGQSQRPRWNVNDFTPGIAAWHEFGHAWGFINGRPGSATNPEALQWENRMREQLYGPLGPRNARRIRH